MKANTLSNISVINKLKDQNKLNDQLLICINNLTLENLIAVKLEMASNEINNRLYGFDIWRRSAHIVRDALLKYSLSMMNKVVLDHLNQIKNSYLSFQHLHKYSQEFRNQQEIQAFAFYTLKFLL